MRLALTIILAALAAACSAAPETPAHSHFEEAGGPVRDTANILSNEAEAELTAMIERTETIYGQQIGVVTVASLHDHAIADFSLEYARAWGLGDAARNDGLMLLVAPNEKQVRIEVGSGLEGSFSDVFCQEILDHHILPAFGEGNFEAGILDGMAQLIERAEQFPSLPANDNDTIAESQEEAA